MTSLGGMEIVAALSKGGMGEVLLAKKQGAHGFSRLVAIKTIRSEISGRDDARKMFLDEARIMARLDHPAIVQVFDFGDEDGVLFLAMELVAGVPLTELMTREVPIAVSARIIAEACRGLHAAHELRDAEGRTLNLVHRDVSPQNLMLSFEAQVKILDFGVALIRNREAPVTQIGLLKGKASYMAPEQLSGGRVDRRADIYAAGVVLHELLAREKLFKELRTEFVVPPSPRSANERVNAIVLRALAVDPAERFQDAREMAVALEDAVQDAPATAVRDYVERSLVAQRVDHEARMKKWLAGATKAPAPVPARVEQATVADRPPLKKRRKWLAPLIFGSGAVIATLILWPTAKPPTPVPPVVVQTEKNEPEPEPDPPPEAVTKKVAKHTPRTHVAPEITPPPATVEYGTITVGADPYGIILIDGQDLGVSPLADHRLPAGDHELELLHPTTRTVLKTRKLTLRANEKLTVKL